MLHLAPLNPNYLYTVGGHGTYRGLGQDHQRIRFKVSTCGTFTVSLGTCSHAFGKDESRTLNFQQTEANTLELFL